VHWFRKYRFLFSILPGVLLIPLPVNSQDKVKQLENQRIQLEKSIEYTEVLLSDTRATKIISLEELALLNDQLINRQKLIDNYNEEKNTRIDTIFQVLFKIDKMAMEVEALREEYAQMIYCAYKNNSVYQRMIWVMASDDINQAYQRLNYFRVYASKRKEQVQQIGLAEEKYLSKVELLELKIDKTEKLLTRLETEKTLLEQEKQLKDLAVISLLKKEKELTKNQDKHKKRAEGLKEQIEHVIAETTDNQLGPGSNNLDALITRTPEDITINNNFALNRGHLPWPVEKGVVSSFFGEHNHPDLQGIKVRNNGINIISHQGTKARAVFTGEVTRVMAMPGFNNVVIIRHGKFLTVYTNLERVFVEQGSMVETKDEIGVIFTDNESIKTELHFEIWEGKTLLDPEQWLASVRSSELLNSPNP
jgi:murein DD-endopeptidase MepM/ murein hydrolase activator NlpD